MMCGITHAMLVCPQVIHHILQDVEVWNVLGKHQPHQVSNMGWSWAKWFHALQPDLLLSERTNAAPLHILHALLPNTISNFSRWRATSGCPQSAMNP